MIPSSEEHPKERHDEAGLSTFEPSRSPNAKCKPNLFSHVEVIPNVVCTSLHCNEKLATIRDLMKWEKLHTFAFIYSISVEETVGWRNAGSSWFVSSTMGNIGRATATAAKAAMKRLEKFIVSVDGICSMFLL